MKKAFIIPIIVLFCFLTLISPLIPDAQSISDKEYRIGAEDVLEIQVWGHEDLHRIVVISKKGAFTFPLIGKVYASDLSVFELENLLRQKLADGYLIKPQITVSVKEYKSQEVFLLGEVKNPGEYILKGKTQILELISEAGGFTGRAGSTIKIVRPTASQHKKGPVSPEEAGENEIITLNIDQLSINGEEDKFLVVRGDSIYVSKAQRIFVIGEVKKPGVIRWEKGLKVYQAISIAGGPTNKGAKNRTKIIRIENGVKREHKPTLSDLVEPDDIIEVPESYF